MQFPLLLILSIIIHYLRINKWAFRRVLLCRIHFGKFILLASLQIYIFLLIFNNAPWASSTLHSKLFFNLGKLESFLTNQHYSTSLTVCTYEEQWWSKERKQDIIVNLYLNMILLLRKQEVANHSQFVTKMLLLRTLEWSMGDIKRCLKF
jgi:hypothetical protein